MSDQDRADRLRLAKEVVRRLDEFALTRAEASVLLGIAAPDVSALRNDTAPDRFSLKALRSYCAQVGLRVELVVTEQPGFNPRIALEAARTAALPDA